MARFIPIVKQQRKYMSLSCTLFIVWRDCLCLLLHELWADFCIKKDSLTDANFIALRTLFEAIDSYQFSRDFWKLLRPTLGVSHFGCPPFFQMQFILDTALKMKGDGNLTHCFLKQNNILNRNRIKKFTLFFVFFFFFEFTWILWI